MRPRSIALLVASLAVGCAGERSSDDDVDAEAELRGDPAAPLFVVPAAPRAARHPFVLVHGFHGSSDNSWSFNGVKEALEADGHFVVAADVQTYNGTPERAATLVSELDRARAEFCAARAGALGIERCFAETKVNIIAHSQGGLDARFAMTRLKYAEHTASLTTMSTPHRGTPLGDAGLDVLTNGRVEAAADALFGWIAKTRSPRALAEDTALRRAFYWLSEQRAQDPANDLPDAPGVYYQSWAGIATLTGARVDAAACDGKTIGGRSARLDVPHDLHFLAVAPLFRRDDQRPNDGHIPVASAKWGEFRGCLPADHLDLLGRPDEQRPGVLRRTGFDHRAFYRVVAHELAERDF